VNATLDATEMAVLNVFWQKNGLGPIRVLTLGNGLDAVDFVVARGPQVLSSAACYCKILNMQPIF